MADVKIAGLPAVSGNPALTDIIEQTTDPAGTPVSEKATYQQIKNAVDGSLSGSDREFASAVTSGDGSTTGKTITSNPDGDIWFKVNSTLEIIGDGVKTKEAYFSNDGGTTARLISAIVAGDTLFWNGTVAGYELSGSDVCGLIYEV